MARQKKIDSEALLDAAEEIVRTRGVSKLTIDALATAMGITKGGVQYSFKSKDILIEAMIKRWTAQYETIFREAAGEREGPDETLLAHLEATQRAESMRSAKSAALLAALVQTEHLELTRREYRQYFDHWCTNDREGKVRRLKFLASEGVFFLRSFGLLQMEDEEWNSIFDDIRNWDRSEESKNN